LWNVEQSKVFALQIAVPQYRSVVLEAVGLHAGRNPNRAGIYNWIPQGHSMHLPPANAPSQPCCATLDTKRDYSATDLAMVASINLHNHENPTNFVSNGQPVGLQEGFSCRLVPHETSQRIRNRNDRSKPFALDRKKY